MVLLISAWHREKLSRGRTVDKQQFPGCLCTFFETCDIYAGSSLQSTRLCLQSFHEAGLTI